MKLLSPASRALQDFLGMVPGVPLRSTPGFTLTPASRAEEGGLAPLIESSQTANKRLLLNCCSSSSHVRARVNPVSSARLAMSERSYL
jgi:hypothetical protein